MSHILRIIIRILNTGLPANIYSLMSRSRDSRTSKGQLKSVRYTLNITGEDFIQQAIRIFNSLPYEIKSINNINTQKKEIKTWVTSNVYLKG